jgi:hypothetical protein
MGCAYRPEKQWTSKLRTGAGLRPYEVDDNKASSTFTISDNSGSFTRLLTRHGYRGTIRWEFHRTFYIDVITVEGKLDESTICLHPHQIEIVSGALCK